MSNLKFDEFSYNGIRVNLRDALDPTLTDLLDEYDRNNLYCPECRMAKLKFTRKTNRCSAFLSTKQGSLVDANEHDQECPYTIEPAKKKQVREYYRELTNKQIEDKLSAAINFYLHQVNGGQNNLPSPHKYNPLIITAVENGCQVHRRLPKRSIYSIYNVTDYELDIPLLFYGKVRLEVTEHPSKFSEGSTYFKLHIISVNTGNTIRRFNIKYLPLPINPKYEYFLSMIVIASRSNNGITSYDLYRKNPLSLKYIPAH